MSGPRRITTTATAATAALVNRSTSLAPSRREPGFGGARGRVYEGPHRPEDFIIPPRDSKGESVRIWTHIQPGHDRAIATIVNGKRFPFRTPGDVFRLALHWALQHLEELEPVISVTGQVDAMLDVLRAEEAAIEFNDFLLRAQSVIGRHIRENAPAEARRIVMDLRRKILAMPDGYWKRRYLSTVKEQFGHLIDGRDGAASLTSFEDHGEVIDDGDSDDELLHDTTH